MLEIASNTVEVDAELVDDRCDPRLAQVAALDEAGSCEPPRIKVLLVEDDPGDQMLVERALTHMARLEPQITTAASLAVARFCLASDDFDVVLADWNLGPECGTALLADVAGACPVIMLSGALSAAMERAGLALGAAAALSKSAIDERLIEAVIEQVLVRHARRETLAAIGDLVQRREPQAAVRGVA